MRRPSLYDAATSNDVQALAKSLSAASEVAGALCVYADLQCSSSTSKHRFAQEEAGQHWIRGVPAWAWGIAVGGGVRSEQCFVLAQHSDG